MRAELKRLQKRLDTTLIYVTHDQVEAMTMSDRIAIMNEGKLQQVDNPKNTYFRPTNQWVAGFIGSPPMNFFDCTLTEKSGQGVLDAGEFQVPLSKETWHAVQKDASTSELVLGVRPEDTKVSRTSVPAGIQGQVYVTEPIGDSVIVDVKVGEALMRARADASFQAHTEDTVYVTFNTERMRIFDKKTGTALI
jgi:multiple sugar transport system ATP-binding protein